MEAHTQAMYVDVTRAAGVRTSHAYFEGRPVTPAGSNVARFFRYAFHGERAEEGLGFSPATRMYQG